MDTLKNGDILFEETIAPAGREQVALFSEATEDPNPIHVDDDFALRAGFRTVLQQGPMTTAHFARLLAKVVGDDAVSALDVTFTAPVYPEDALTLRAEVAEPGPVTTRCSLTAVNGDGTQTAKGFADVRTPA
jgi:acyl dehydratase